MYKLDDEWSGIDPALLGRIILFKGNIEHHGNPPNKSYKGLRSSLVYKTMRKVHYLQDEKKKFLHTYF